MSNSTTLRCMLSSSRSINQLVNRSRSTSSINQSINQSTSSVNRSINQSINQSAGSVNCLYTNCRPFSNQTNATSSVGIDVNHQSHQPAFQSINQSNNQSVNQSVNQSLHQSTNQSISQPINQSINQSKFNPFYWDDSLPVSQSSTLPASFYTHQSVLANEKLSLFSNEWIYIGRIDDVAEVGQFYTGEFLNEPYVIVRDAETDNQSISQSTNQSVSQSTNQSVNQSINQSTSGIRGFFNVCCHHAMPVAKGRGRCDEFVCGYHGWRYALNGRLKRATKMAGIENFKASSISLSEFPVKVVGPFLFAHFDFEKRRNGTFTNQSINQSKKPSVDQSINQSVNELTHPSSSGLDRMHETLFSTNYQSMRHLKTLTYDVHCNWKVFVDNYLDGGLHVQYAHPSLNDEIDMSNYTIASYDRCSIQLTNAKNQQTSDRVHGQAKYVFVYPNLMINRYGDWMDTNAVIPINQSTCRVLIDYFLDSNMIDDTSINQSINQSISQSANQSINQSAEQSINQSINQSIEASDQIQREDVELCELVQRGLSSVGYSKYGGRYAPNVELAMHDFHRLYYQSIKYRYQ